MRKEIPLALASPETTRSICRHLFRADNGEPLEITSYQARIIKRIFFKEPKMVVCTAATRAGKSLAVALGVILLAVFRSGEKIRLIAPTLNHTKIVMGYVIQHILDSSVLSGQLLFDVKGMGVERLKKELTKQKLVFRDGSEVMAITADISGEGRSLMGFGGSFVVVDEAENIDTEIMRTKVMRMLGDSPDSGIFLIGNPVSHGFMYEKAGDDDWSFMRIGWRDCVREGRLTEKFVNDRRDEMTSNEFKVWYEAEWPDEMEDQLFSRVDLENFKASLTKEEKELLKKKPDRKSLGCDIARYGSDFSVLYKLVLYDDVWFVTDCKRFEKKDLMSTTGAIVAWDREEKFDSIVVDDSGLGSGVTDRLREIDQTRGKVVAFVAGESPWRLKRKLTAKEEEDNKLFLNKKAFQYRKFESLCRKKKVRLAEERFRNRLLSEMEKMKYEFSSGGKLKVVDPEDKSPDFADSVALALFSGVKFVFAFV